MAGVLHPHQELGWVRDTAELVKTLHDGDGIQWSGDPDLFLSQGVITNQRGDILARRWEVWRACEDGMERMIGHWRMEEYDRIIFDLARMRAETPGHVDTGDRIDAHNAGIESANSQKFRDSAGELIEHAAKLKHDTTEGRSVFRGMPGFRKDDSAR